MPLFDLIWHCLLSDSLQPFKLGQLPIIPFTAGVYMLHQLRNLLLTVQAMARFFEKHERERAPVFFAVTLKVYLRKTIK